MDADFWQRKWDANSLGFHEGRPNALLVKHLDTLALERGSRLLLPLCGKTRDIAWLLSKGHRIAGVELVRTAVEQLFEALEVEPARTPVGPLTRFRSGHLDVFQGDLFALSAGALGAVDAVYDRAALVAFDATGRRRYVDHLHAVSGGVRQLLMCLEYDPTLMSGPPFAVTGDEVRALYGDRYEIARLDAESVEGGLKGVEATETGW